MSSLRRLLILVLLCAAGPSSGQAPPPKFSAVQLDNLASSTIPLGKCGIWLNSSCAPQARRADGTDVAMSGGGGGGDCSATLTATTPVRCNGSATCDACNNYTLSLAASGVTAATYGSASQVPVCAVNGYGLATSCTNTTIAIPASQVTSGTLPVARGGTNATSGGSLGSVACWGSGNAYAFTAAPTSTHDLLHGNPSGTGVASWGAVALATEVSGTLPWANLPATVSYRPYFDIRDYGAVANADIAPAVQLAFNAACSAGGGFVVVPSRDSSGALVVWLWQSAVTVNCQPGGIGPPTQLGLVGPGAILVSAQAGVPYTALTVQQVLNTRDLRWYGSLDLAHPSTGMNPITALIRSVGGINSQDNQYNGLKLDRPVGTFSLQPENAVLVSTAIRSTRDQFSAIAGSNQSVIRAADWTELVVRDFWIRDFYIVNGVTMSPTDGGEYPYASIVAIRPANGAEQHHFAAQSVIIENGRIDEGSGGLGEQIIIWRGFGETTEKAQFVTIRNVSSMVPPTSGSAAIRLDGVHKASIEDWFVFAGSGGGRALYADVVDELTIRRTFTCTNCNPAWPANDKVLITSGVGLVRAEDSHLDLVTNNSALQTIIEGASRPRNLMSYASGSRPAASTAPRSLLWNSSTSRLNASDGSSWLDIPFGVIGTDIQAYDADLAAMASLSPTPGMLSRTGAGAFAARTLACGSSTCSWSNGDGASGAPTVTIAGTTVNGTTCTPGSTCTVTAAPSGSASGDLGSTYPSPTVVALRGKALATSIGSAGAGQDGYCVRWSNGASEYQLSSCPGGGGGATITFTAPAEMSVSGSPGDTIGVSWASASGRKFIASPSDGTSGAYAGRAIVAADVPDLSATYQPTDADLTALAAMSCSGVIVRTGSNTYACRTVTASGGVAVSNGDGVSGAPAFSVDQTFSPSWTGTHNFSGGGVTLPTATVPAQTVDGRVVWDSDDDLLTVGTGAARKTMCDLDSTQTLAGKTLTTPTIASFTNATHNHTNAAGGGTITVAAISDIAASYQPLDSDLTAVAALASTAGMLSRTGAGAFAARTLACSNSECTWTNGDGSAGAPSLAITYGTTSHSACQGNDTRLPPAPSGAGKVIYDTGSAYAALAAGSSGQCLKSGGAGAPTWGSCSAGGADASSIQGVAVNAAAPSSGDVLCYVSGAGEWQPCASNVASPGAAGGWLYSDGSAWARHAACSAGQYIRGNGAASPTCSSIVSGDLPDLSATYQPTDADLTAVAGLASTAGMLSRTGAGAFAARTLACGSSTCSWSNGDGAAGAPTITVAATTVNGVTCTPGSTCEVQRFLNASRARVNNSADTFYSEMASAATANRVATLPDATGTLAMLGLAQTWSAVQTHNNAGRLRINNSADTFYSEITSAATANRTWTLPDATDTACGLAATQTLAAKTLTAPVINGCTSSGSTAIDFSGNTGAFSSSTGAVTLGGYTTVAKAAQSSGAGVQLTVTGASDTAQTASTEKPLVYLNGNRTVQWATGALTTQREVRVAAPTYAFVAASTITNAATLAISGAPTAGTNATITNAHALWVEAGRARFDGGVTLGTGQTLLAGANTLIGAVSDKLNGLMIAFGSQAVGDLLQADSTTTMARLGAGAAGSFLRAAGAASLLAWSTLILPNAATAGDLFYGSSTNTMGALALGTAGRALVVNPGATAPQWGRFLDMYKSCTSTTTGGGATDCSFDALPSGLGSSNAKSFRGTITCRLTGNGAGGGTVALTAGTSAGGTDVLLSQTITAGTTTVGTPYGDKSDGSELGTKADSARGYNLYIDGGSTVSVRLGAPSGTVSGAVTVQCFLDGVTM